MLSEAILHKDFSLLFSCNLSYFRDKFLEELKSIPEVHFASRVHYEYYKKFVAPRLSFDVRRVDRGHVRTNKLEFYVSQNYIFISVEEVKVEKSSRYAYFFLLGFNDNYKLFVNELELPLRPMKFRWGALKLAVEGVEVYEIEDEEVLSLLRLKGQSEGYAVIGEEGRYRVQGEVVISIVDVGESFDELLRRTMLREVEDYIIAWIHEKVAFALTNIGFNVELTPRAQSIFIREAAKGLGIRDKVAAARKLAERLAEELVRDRLLDVEVVDFVVEQASSERYDFTVRLRMTTKDGDVIIAINLLKDSVTVQADMSGLLGKLREELMSELIEQVKASRRDFGFYIGNHKITLRNCLSPSIVLRPSLKTLNFLSVSEIRVQAFGYIFDRDSEILLQHHEHGVTIVRFARPAIARIDVIDVPTDYLSNVNNIVFSMLAKS